MDQEWIVKLLEHSVRKKTNKQTTILVEKTELTRKHSSLGKDLGPAGASSCNRVVLARCLPSLASV